MTHFNELYDRLWIIHSTRAVLKVETWRLNLKDQDDLGSTGRISLAKDSPLLPLLVGYFWDLKNAKRV